MPNRSRGRPTKRTPESEHTVMEALKIGLSLVTAAGLAGVHRDTLYGWRKADEDFDREVIRARESAKMFVAGKLIENIRNGNVTAQIFWLKTRTSEFQEKQQVEHTGNLAVTLSEFLNMEAEPEQTETDDG